MSAGRRAHGRRSSPLAAVRARQRRDHRSVAQAAGGESLVRMAGRDRSRGSSGAAPRAAAAARPASRTATRAARGRPRRWGSASRPVAARARHRSPAQRKPPPERSGGGAFADDQVARPGRASSRASKRTNVGTTGPAACTRWRRRSAVHACAGTRTANPSAVAVELGGAARRDLDRREGLRGEAIRRRRPSRDGARGADAARADGSSQARAAPAGPTPAPRATSPRRSPSRGRARSRARRVDARQHDLGVLARAVGPREQLTPRQRDDVDIAAHGRPRTDRYGVRARVTLRVEAQPAETASRAALVVGGRASRAPGRRRRSTGHGLPAIDAARHADGHA